MAGDTIIARLKVIGGRRFKEEMDGAGESTDRLGKKASGTRKGFGDMEKGSVNAGRGLKALAAVCLIVGGVQGIGLLVQATGAGIIALGALGIAALAAGGVLAGFAMGATARFKQMADVGGSTANDLKDRFGEFKTLLSDELGPAFDPVFKGLAQAMGPISDLVREIAPAFKVLGQSIGTAIGDAATGLAGLGPEISQLLRSVADLVPSLVPALVALFRIFLMIANAAMPYLIQGLDWLTDKLQGVSQATIDSGIASAFSTLGDVFGTVAAIVAVLAPVFMALASGLAQISEGALPGVTAGLRDVADGFEAIVASGALKTLASAIGATFAAIASVVGTVLTELQKYGLLKPVIIGLTAAFVAFKVAMIAINLVMSVNPVVAIIAAIAALAVGVVYAYRRFEGFRNAVNGAWSVLKAIGTWIGANWKLVIGLLGGPVTAVVGLIVNNFGRIRGAVSSVVGWVRDRFNGMIGFLRGLGGKVGSALKSFGDMLLAPFRAAGDAIQAVLDKLGGLGKALDLAIPGGKRGLLSDDGLFGIKGVPLLADGGTLSSGGAAIVGEQGPELVTLPAGSTVHPANSPQTKAARSTSTATTGAVSSAGAGPRTVRQPLRVVLEVAKRQLAEVMADIEIDVDAGTLA